MNAVACSNKLRIDFTKVDEKFVKNGVPKIVGVHDWDSVRNRNNGG